MIFKIFKKARNPKLTSIKEAGNVFMMLFGAVGMVGVVGASTMTVMKGPVQTMSHVTKRTVAENSMIAAGKLALIASGSQTNSDCDGDLILEPLEHGAAITGFTGGGQVPAIVGVGKQDPWGSTYGYCVWDHGITIDDAACGGSSQNRLSGSNAIDQYVIAMVSAGPDGVFDTSCIDYVDSTTPTLNQTSGSDDLVLGYTYAEATAAAAGLWSLSDPDTATIQKDLIVRNDADTADTFALDGDTGNLTLGSGAIGEFPSIRTDYIQTYNNANIEVTSPITIPGTSTIDMGEMLIGKGNGSVAAGADVWMSGSGLISAEDNLYLISDSDGDNVGNIAFAAGTDTNAATRLMTIEPTGNVGIGTSGPSAKLDVVGSTELNGTLAVTSTTQLNGTLAVTSTTQLNGTLNVTNAAITSNGGTIRDANGGWIRTYGDTGWYNGTYGGGWYMIDTTWVRSYVNKSIYTGGIMRADASMRSPIFYDQDNTGYYLNPASTSRLNSINGNTYYYASDRRLKENIITLPEERVNQLYDVRGVEFDWKESGDHDIGFIAQEIEKYFPDLVSEMDDGIKAVKYGNMVPILLEAIKAQKIEIDENKNRIVELEDRFKALEALVFPSASSIEGQLKPVMVDVETLMPEEGNFSEEIEPPADKPDPLPESIDISNLGAVSNSAQSCSKPKTPTCLSAENPDRCSDRVVAYIYESRIYALCTRTDEALIKPFEANYNEVIAKASGKGMAPADTRLWYFDESHVFAFQGVLDYEAALTPVSASQLAADAPKSEIVKVDDQETMIETAEDIIVDE